jgi:hypothetical protein
MLTNIDQQELEGCVDSDTCIPQKVGQLRCSNRRLLVNCVARYISTESEIICGVPGKEWLSEADVLSEDIKILKKASGKCEDCDSYKIAEFRKTLHAR